MNVGSLYEVKKYFWFLFSTKAEASKTFLSSLALSEPKYSDLSYISPKSVAVLLEKDTCSIKVLTSNGEVGWIRYRQDLLGNISFYFKKVK